MVPGHQSIADSNVVSSAMPSSFTLLPVWLSRMTRVGVAVMPFDRAVSMSVLINRSTRSMSFAHFPVEPGPVQESAMCRQAAPPLPAD